MPPKPFTAEDYLNRLRDADHMQAKISEEEEHEYSTHYADRTITYLRRKLGAERRTLKDIGTNKDELEKLRGQGYLMSARAHLNMLRQGSLRYNRHLKRIKQDLVIACGTLADLPTTDDELAALKVRGIRLLAEDYDSRVALGSSALPHLRILKRELTDAGLSPQDIGRSEDLFQPLEQQPNLNSSTR